MCLKFDLGPFLESFRREGVRFTFADKIWSWPLKMGVVGRYVRWLYNETVKFRKNTEI